jgi:hypothetical protein
VKVPSSTTQLDGSALSARPSRIRRAQVPSTITVTPADLEATKSWRSAASSALGGGTSFDAVIGALRQHLKAGRTQARDRLTALLACCDTFLDETAPDTAGRKGRRVILVEDLRAEVSRDLGRLAAEERYVNAAYAEPDPDQPGRAGFWNLGNAETVRAGARNLMMGQTAPNEGVFGGFDAKALAEVRQHRLTEAEVLGIRAYTAKNFAYINPAMVSHQQVDAPQPDTPNEALTDAEARDTANAEWWGAMRARIGAEQAKAQVMSERALQAAAAQLGSEGALHAATALGGLQKLPPWEGTAYRGTSYPAQLVSRDLEPGRKIRWDSFTSTTRREAKAKEFAWGKYPTVFTIHVVDGRDLRRLSVFHDLEQEVLLLPGAEFEVLDVRAPVGAKEKTYRVELQQLA